MGVTGPVGSQHPGSCAGAGGPASGPRTRGVACAVYLPVPGPPAEHLVQIRSRGCESCPGAPRVGRVPVEDPATGAFTGLRRARCLGSEFDLNIQVEAAGAAVWECRTVPATAWCLSTWVPPWAPAVGVLPSPACGQAALRW